MSRRRPSGLIRLRGQMVYRWHPESPGMRVVVFCSWWKRKRRPFATVREVESARRPTFDATRAR